MLKKLLKTIIVEISWWFAGRYQKKFRPTVIGVAGSVGKTGAKRAIALTLASNKRVAWQNGNYNDIVTVPLIFFGLTEPSVFNPIGWMVVFGRMTVGLFTNKPAEVVVVELGTDAPGQIPAFKDRLKLDYAVVTAVSYEHMENFADIQAVASEELSIAEYSEKVYVTRQIKDDGFLMPQADTDKFMVYGGTKGKLSVSAASGGGQQIEIKTSSSTYRITPKLIGPHQFDSLLISAELAERLGVPARELEKGLSSVEPMPGRMQLLEGKDGSLIIDDTYNASPEAVKAALDYLYTLGQKKRIAVIGNMNEMGVISEELHKEIGKYCSSDKLNEVITIGPDANRYLATAAKAAGNSVTSMDSPVDIGKYLAEKDLTDTAVLLKGSQNRVFLEEAIKPILADSSDRSKLVRQSKYWLTQKAKQFKGIE